MEKSTTDVTQFIETLPDAVRDDIRQLDAAIAAEMSGLSRVLYTGKFWGGSDQEIIGYGDLVTTRSDGSSVRWFVVGLAVQKNYLSLYVSAVEDGEYLSEKYGKQLGKVKTGKSSISFNSVADIDLDQLRWLVGRAREITEADSGT